MRARYPRPTIAPTSPCRGSTLLRKPLQVFRVPPERTLSLDESSGRSRKLSEPDPKGCVPNHQRQRTAFETHNGRSASTAGTALNAPFRTSVTRAPLTRTTRSVKGHNISLTSGNPEKLETAVAFIRRGFGEGKLKPIINRIFRFDEIVEAHRYLEGNNQFGKIVATL